MPAPAHRTRLPCTLEMIQHIVDQNTQPGASMHQVMLAPSRILFVLAFKWIHLKNSRSFGWHTSVYVDWCSVRPKWPTVIKLIITRTRISKQSSSVCCMLKTYVMILVCLSGSLPTTRHINQYRLYFWYINSLSILWDSMRIHFYLTVCGVIYSVYCIRIYKRPSSHPPLTLD